MRTIMQAANLLAFSLLCAGSGPGIAQTYPPSNVTAGHHALPQDVTFTTLITAPLPTFGLTGDRAGNLYTPGRAITAGGSCPAWRVDPDGRSLVVVGYIPSFNAITPCVANGIALSDAGGVFVAETVSGRVYNFTPNETTPPIATVFATGMPGALSIAFDKKGSLWVTDGVAGLGSVWKISPSGGNGTLQFRVPPLRNSIGVGREVRRFPTGTTAGLGVATGIAFDRNGDLFISDVSRGAIWKVEFDQNGSLKSPTDCDTTFANGTLCLSNIFVAHPLISGAVGIALDRAGNIWVALAERNAIAVVTRDGKVEEIFRNPVNGATNLRNAGDLSVGNNHILEFPGTPFLRAKRFCVSSFDSDVQDNSPNSVGELDGSAFRGKISCMDQDLALPGLPLPVK